ncbi:hypothetical protein DFH01_05845 [Falsiroseomonas bella]|uniref:YjbF family lipoprotein n=1 Tax=Falsiroseomonas bella TaxID=2184016 RepID=A0A317FJH3_9PROT|nr:YjbF family lipoprotein [Falsiroseomonas bella]PWS38773.1 hypothetical protein DFH01_05845 [Falsiroseomonas bella]
MILPGWEATRRWRIVGALGLVALLGACGDTPTAQALRRTAPEAAAPPPVQGPHLLLVAPRRAVLLPVSGGAPRAIWRSEAGNIAIATEGPRIVATAGLRQMLMATRFEGPDPLDHPLALRGTEAFARRSVDLATNERDPSTMRFGVALDCRLSGRDEAGWVVVEERCTGGGASFTNRFWVQPESGAVLRSEQWAGDEAGVLTLEMRGF